MKKKTPIQQKIAKVLFEYNRNKITNNSAINKIEKLIEERQAEMLTNHFVIEGVISCKEDIDNDELLDKFISFVENNGFSFGGTIYPEDSEKNK